MNEYEAKLGKLFEAMELQGYDAFFKGDRGKARDTLARHLDTMSRYLDAVYAQESAEATIAGGADKGARDELERLNGMRTTSHNAAMASLEVINRIFDAYGIEPFIEVDTMDNRSDIGEKIAAYVSVMFLGCDKGISRSDTARLAHETNVDQKKRSEILSTFLDKLLDESIDSRMEQDARTI